MSSRHRIVNFILFFPLVCLALIVAALSRALPTFPIPQQSRTVVDAGGTLVHIAMPFRGSVLHDIGAFIYLGDTSAPKTLVNAGGSLDRAWFSIDQTCKVYPEVEQTDSIWDESVRATDEDMLRYNPGAYVTTGIGPYGPFSFYRSIGLPVVFTSAFEDKTWDDMSYRAARVMTAIIGHPELGEALVAWNKQAYTELAMELQPETLSSRPRALFINATRLSQKSAIIHEGTLLADYLPRMGVVNAAAGWSAVQMDDAERVLAMDPDFIFLEGLPAGPPSYPKMMATQGPAQFMRDPKWQGLKAVKEHRVYRSLFSFEENLHLQPFTVRWVAEIVHPDRIRSNFRELIRAHYLKWFGYHFSDDYIDDFIYMDENKDQPGYRRFARTSTISHDVGTSPESPGIWAKRLPCPDVGRLETSWDGNARGGGAH